MPLKQGSDQAITLIIRHLTQNKTCFQCLDIPFQGRNERCKHVGWGDEGSPTNTVSPLLNPLQFLLTHSLLHSPTHDQLFRHCEEHSDAAVQGLGKQLDCFALLAMTTNCFSGLPRYARNDGPVGDGAGDEWGSQRE